MASLRNKLPRFAGAAGQLFRRSKFLDGTLKTYFAPGQMPNGMADSNGYINPLDWNQANTLLRAPQQVWLGAYLFAGVFPNINDQTPWYYTWDYASVMSGTRDRIKALRPGKTWVDITDFNQYGSGPSSNATYTSAGFGLTPYPFQVVNNNTNPPISVFGPPGSSHPTHYKSNLSLNRYSHVVAPDPSESFFGTDFLYILMCGYVYPLGAGVFGESPNLPLSGDPLVIYKNCVNQIFGSYPKFAGYSVYFYVIDNGFRNVWGGYGDDVISNYIPVLNYFQGVASQLANYGYHCVGFPDPTVITTDSLVSLIASHYNFDPDTGEDLPVS